MKAVICSFQLGLNASEADLPVLVYFYGGAFYIGNSTYDAYGPEFLIDQDLVIVTVNYRLGPFGFLSTEDTVIPGNFGLKDQQFALKWVQNEIQKFGGDPKKVTISGNSAGAASVGYQILNEKSKGLFRAAILSSGSPLNSWAIQRHPRKIAYLTAQYVNNSKIVKTSEELVQFLRSVPAIDLRKASLEVMKLDPFEVNQFSNGYFYAPVKDAFMQDGFLKKSSYELLESGNFSFVPLMIGIVSEEALALSEGSGIRKLFELFDSSRELLVNDLFDVVSIEQKKSIGKLIHETYVNGNKSLVEDLSKGIRFLSDQCINNGVLKHANFASHFVNVFLYQFSYDGLMGNFSGTLEGVTHTEDMNYIWLRNLPTANNLNINAFPDNDRLTQKRILKLYTNFVKYLNPTPEKDPILQNIDWQPMNSKGSNETVYLDIDIDLQLKTNLKHDTYLKFNEIFLKYAVKPYTTY